MRNQAFILKFKSAHSGYRDQLRLRLMMLHRPPAEQSLIINQESRKNNVHLTIMFVSNFEFDTIYCNILRIYNSLNYHIFMCLQQLYF